MPPFKGLIGSIRNYPIFYSCHRSKSGILLGNLVVSYQNAKQKSRISSTLIEMRHFFLLFWITSNLLSFLQKWWDTSFCFTFFGNAVRLTAAFLHSIMIEYTLNIHVDPWTRFMKNLKLCHFSLAGQYIGVPDHHFIALEACYTNATYYMQHRICSMQ